MLRTTAGLATAAMLFGTLACAGNTAGGADETAAAQDTSEVQTPPGYSGMEQDTTGTQHEPTAVDTFLNEQGTGVPTDTMGYGGLEHPDTSGTAGQDTGQTGWSDTTGATGVDTSGMTGTTDTSGQTGWDTTGQQSGWDTTGQRGAMDTTGQQSGWDTTGQR
ncbi:hypothetical protein BH24GEM1_BH24GEM1_19630 [soil metagenome]